MRFLFLGCSYFEVKKGLTSKVLHQAKNKPGFGLSLSLLLDARGAMCVVWWRPLSHG